VVKKVFEMLSFLVQVEGVDGEGGIEDHKILEGCLG